MKISWHGHSCFIIETESKHRLIIDPFISGNPLSDLNVETLEIDAILITHAHEDHVGDAIPIAHRNNAPIISIVEIADYFESLGIHGIGFNCGGSMTFDFGTIKFVQAFHSSSYGGVTLGTASGIVIDDGYHRVYHAGDTALFSDMLFFSDVDLALLPIGDRFTMGIEDAIIAASLIQAQVFIPMHYNTFDSIKQDPQKFINGIKPYKGYIPKVGEVLLIENLLK